MHFNLRAERDAAVRRFVMESLALLPLVLGFLLWLAFFSWKRKRDDRKAGMKILEDEV